MELGDDWHTEQSLHEINASIPRRVRLAAESRMVFLIFAMSLIGGLIWFSWLSFDSLKELRQRDALQQSGKEALGQVTKISGARSVFVYYEFRVGGTDYQGKIELDDEVAPNTADRLSKHVSKGDQIPVQFLPADPSVNHPIGWAWWSWWDLVPQLFFLGIACFGVGGAVFLLRLRKLARKGWVVEGTVTACAPNRSKFSVDYEFRAEDDSLFEGSDSFCADEYQLGSRIRVTYLRNNPKRNSTYPMSDFDNGEV